MRRVLMLTPHFPPDSSAGTHRVRLLAPHLPEYGWEPVVVTADPATCEGELDFGLEKLIPSTLRVIRCRAWSPKWTRRLGIGDLGLRMLQPAYRTCKDLLTREPVDALFVTTYPIYTALLGPALKRSFGVPYVVDVQDPWVGAWGRTVGGGRAGTPDLKSRMTRAIAARLEGPVMRGASAVTTVSAGTYEEIVGRQPTLRDTPWKTIPVGVEPGEFTRSPQELPANRYFHSADGLVHICSVGTILPLGLEVVRALLSGAAMLRARRPALAGKARLHFFGTSNQRVDGAEPRVLGLAESLGVSDLVTEHPSRVDYLEAVRLQLDAGALLLLGSSEPHYTASRLYPALAARRPILALYQEQSSVVDILRRYTRAPSVRVISFSDRHAAESRIADIAACLEALLDSPQYGAADVDARVLADFSARTLAGQLAEVLTAVA